MDNELINYYLIDLYVNLNESFTKEILNPINGVL